MPSYSKTPLAKKLGIKSTDSTFLYNVPVDYFEKLELAETDVVIQKNPKEESADFIHVFVKEQQDLKAIASACKSCLKKSGMMWISWPKGSSKIITDLKRDYIREYILNIGLVDVKVASYDDDWSGLKFVYRVKDR